MVNILRIHLCYDVLKLKTYAEIRLCFFDRSVNKLTVMFRWDLQVYFSIYQSPRVLIFVS